MFFFQFKSQEYYFSFFGMDIGIVKLFLQKKICFSLKQNLQKLQQTAF
jgi:hypothetical protein